VRCKSSMLIPKCLTQYLTSSSWSIAILLRSSEGRFLREIILRFQILARVAGRDDNPRAKKAFPLREQRVF
jgi:hypothetical protein